MGDSILSLDVQVGRLDQLWYQQADPVAGNCASTNTERSNDCDSEAMIEFDVLGSEEIPKLKSNVTVVVVLRPTSDGWFAEIPDAHIYEFGASQQEARNAAIGTLESLRDVYVNEPDDALTAGAITLRDWLSSIF